VARVIGYEHIKTTLMDDVLPTQHRNLSLETEESIRDILVGCGLQETINYALTVPENHDKINRDPIGTAEQNTPFITLVNPLSAKRRVMRRSMLVSALENLEYNYRYTQRMAVFEIGRVYLPEQGDGVRPYEESRLSILLVGPRRVSSVHPDPAGAEDFDFFDLKGIVETLLSRLGLQAHEYEFVAQRNNPTFTPTCAALKIHGEVQGLLGELRPQVQAEFDVPTAARVYVADIRIAPLLKPSWELRPMEKISNYPPVVEDLAFVVAEEVTAHRLQESIRKAGGSLLTKVELFDIYRGQPVPAGQKSMAYKLTYESLEGNMRDEQVVSIRNRIIQQVAESVGGTLRE
jgi:phenylalanyl-tRNA synthetase beta chain